MEQPCSNQTIAFTLAISCHICLGKVKQPVTCPNHHVFCRTCLDVWLSRTSACPTCRVPINDQNPYTVIIGGAELQDSSQDRQWDLLRARIEISLRAYEDEIKAHKSRTNKLENENRDLLEKLANHVQRNEQTENLSDFTVLNEQLRDVSQLYEKAKKEVSELKKTNRSLIDRNVNLTRETERLKLEVSKRSPQKFGRITVATLQSKLDESDKKVKQLQKALEKTDEYVNELQQKMKNCKCSDGETKGVSLSSLTNVSDVDRSKLHEPSTDRIPCQRNLMSSLDLASCSSEPAVRHRIKLHRPAEGSTEMNYPRSTQVAAMRVASSKIQNSRIDSTKTNMQYSEVPSKLFKPRSSEYDRTSAIMTSQSGQIIAVNVNKSPTKRKRDDH